MQRKLYVIIILSFLLVGCGLNTQPTGATQNDALTTSPTLESPTSSADAVLTPKSLSNAGSTTINPTVENSKCFYASAAE